MVKQNNSRMFCILCAKGQNFIKKKKSFQLLSFLTESRSHAVLFFFS